MIRVVRNCAECPLESTEENVKVCSVSTPSKRPIPDESDRPNWCPLRREQVIIRQFQ